MKFLFALMLACVALSACTFNYEVSVAQGTPKKVAEAQR